MSEGSVRSLCECGRYLESPLRAKCQACQSLEDRKNNRQEVARQCGTPIRYRAATIPAGIPAPGDKENVFLSGLPGRGKTWAATAMMIEWAIPRPSLKVFWRRSSDILIELKSSFDNPKLDEAAIIDKYRTADLFLVDDLGAEKVSEWSISAIYSILSGRYDDMRPTYITSNLSISKLRGWHPRIASRIASYEVACEIDGVDRRVAK